MSLTEVPQDYKPPVPIQSDRAKQIANRVTTFALMLEGVARINGELTLDPIRREEIRRIAVRMVAAVDPIAVMRAQSRARLAFARLCRERVEMVKAEETHSARSAIECALDLAYDALTDNGVQGRATVEALIAGYEAELERAL